MKLQSKTVDFLHTRKNFSLQIMRMRIFDLLLNFAR